jgi:hypothetical protein
LFGVPAERSARAVERVREAGDARAACIGIVAAPDPEGSLIEIGAER